MATILPKKRRSRNRFKALGSICPTAKTVPDAPPSSCTSDPDDRAGTGCALSTETGSPLPLPQLDDAGETPATRSDRHDVSAPAFLGDNLFGTQENEPETDIAVRQQFEIEPAPNCTEDTSAIFSEETDPMSISNWKVLWGLLVTLGTLKMTKQMYQAMRTVADTFSRISRRPWTADEDETEHMDRTNDMRISCLPHFTTLHRIYRPILLKKLMPRANDFLERVDMSKAGARCINYGENGQPLTSVRIILPSEYARADMSTGPVFSAMKSTSLEAFRGTEGFGSTPLISTRECVDVWPLIAARDWFYGPPQCTNVDIDGNSDFQSSFCEVGDTVRVTVPGRSPLAAPLLHSFGDTEAPPSGTHLKGVFVAIWTVHHVSRRNSPDFDHITGHCLSPSDERNARHMSFASYSSLSDVEASGTGRNRKRHRRSELNLDSWKKPLLKPGDTVTMLRPCSTAATADPALPTAAARTAEPTLPTACTAGGTLASARTAESALAECNLESSIPRLQSVGLVESPSTQPDVSSEGPDCSRLYIVHRFWGEREERSRHFLWVPSNLHCDLPQWDIDGNIDLERLCHAPYTTRQQCYGDVAKVSLLQQHTGGRGTQRYSPTSSLGTLRTGEKYFIYRFLLYWDGFEMAAGKSATGEGFYLLCLNLPVQSRASSSASASSAYHLPVLNLMPYFAV